MKKGILGGLLGGAVLFVWGAFSHMALPLGTVGLRSIPPALEPAVLGAMQSGMTERALYFFPGLDPRKKTTRSAGRSRDSFSLASVGNERSHA